MSVLETIGETTFTNEADVERRLVEPLLLAFGYEDNDIRPKHAVIFQEGRSGRPHEADFAIFAGPEASKNASLLIIEVKRPGETLDDGKEQGESYAANLHAPFLIVTNGLDLELWQLQPSCESERVYSSSVKCLASRFDELHRLIAKDILDRSAAVEILAHDRSGMKMFVISGSPVAKPASLARGRIATPSPSHARHLVRLPVDPLEGGIRVVDEAHERDAEDERRLYPRPGENATN